MRVEITQFNDRHASLRLIDDLDLADVMKNTHNGRIFAYLDLWEKGSSTDEQRKHYWALVNDYHKYTGDRKGIINLRLKSLWMITKDTDKEPSVARGKMSKSDVAEWLQMIIEFYIDNGIPFHHPEGYVPADVSKMMYKLTLNRMCVVCGKPHAEIAHFDGTVGMGRNRNTIDHTQSKYLALCDTHHKQQHNMGEKSFLDFYQLVPLKLDRDDLKKLNVM